MIGHLERESLVLTSRWRRLQRVYWYDVVGLEGQRLHFRDGQVTLDEASRAAVASVLEDRSNDRTPLSSPGALRERLHVIASGPGYWPGRWLDVLLRHAAALECSDVHVGILGDRLHVDVRRHGTLVPLLSMPPETLASLVGAAKSAAGLRTYVHDVIQEGRLRVAAPDIDVRLSVLPTVAGERLAFRLPDPGVRSLRLAELGFDATELAGLESLLRRRSGLLLVTGPSGSGKTTTTYAALRHILTRDGDRSRVATVEDPPEAVLDGATQVKLNPAHGLDMEAAIAHLLRQDVDVIAVGEIRDRETARAAVGAALTGHLVLATLHCGSASEAVHRLFELGVPADRLAHAVAGILGQRLTRLSCVACTAGVSVTCPRCLGTGYDGRTAVAELLFVDDAIRTVIGAGGAPSGPPRPVAQLAAARAAIGLTTPSEVAACIA